MDNFTAVCGEDEIIGVHCTHGINRTGYFICRYLVQQLGWKLQHALKAFQEARGYPIERQNYVNELKRTPCGRKIDTSKVTLTAETVHRKKRSVKQRPPSNHPAGRLPPPPPQFIMGPPGPGFAPPRRGFTNGAPFPPPRFNYGVTPQSNFGPRGPAGPVPPPGPRFGPRIGPRMGIRPPMPPPMAPHLRGPPRMPILPGMPIPPRMAGASRMPGPPRLPMGPTPRMPPGKMTPHRLPLPLHHMPSKRNSLPPGKRQTRANTAMAKRIKDQDFTVDTFEENLTAQPQKKIKKL